MKFRSLCFSATLLAAQSAFAAEYPDSLHGKWAMDPAYCATGLEISKKFASSGTEETCEALKVTPSGDTFTIREKCSGEGGSATQIATYQVSGNTMTKTYRGFVNKHQRCGAAPAPASSAKTCKVNEGQAGVTTFLDERMKKSGSSVRDFDNYQFKAEKTITVNKSQLLVGQLLNQGGKVIEAKSYAMADEWTCK